jgi:hypothetical protein
LESYAQVSLTSSLCVERVLDFVGDLLGFGLEGLPASPSAALTRLRIREKSGSPE